MHTCLSFLPSFQFGTNTSVHRCIPAAGLPFRHPLFKCNSFARFSFFGVDPRRRRRLRGNDKEQTGKERGCEECKIPALARCIGVWYGETPSFDNSREQSHDGHPAEYEQDLQKGLPGMTKKQKQTLTRAMHSTGDIKGKLHTKHLVLFSLQRHQCDDSYQTQQLKKGALWWFPLLAMKVKKK